MGIFFLAVGATAGLSSRAVAEQQYDIVLKGGHVVDAKNNIDAPMDVAIVGGKIAKVAAGIPADQARQVVRVDGLYVTPGLVDIHVHVYAGTGAAGVYAGQWSVFPDGHTFRSGVTTAVDAGTSGWRNFPDFKHRVIDRARTRTLAWLNIVSHGMSGHEHEQNQQEMDPQAAAEMIRRFPDLIVGIKTAHYGGLEWVAVERAVAAGKLTERPVMVDFGTFPPERPFEELVLHKLRPGDIYTHFYLSAVPMLDARGRVRPYLAEARKRGVKFDVGHGAHSFSWHQAAPAVSQGLWPDSISTDLHALSMNAGMKDMTTTMSKLLALGVPLQEVIARSTWAPAELIHRPELGHLSVGAPADVAVLRLRKGKFGLIDAQSVRLDATEKLQCELTLRAGQVVWDLGGRAGSPYHSNQTSP